MSDIVELFIPFSGFYESRHDDLLNSEIAAMFSDENGEPYRDIVDNASFACDWALVSTEYAKGYAESFAEAYGLHTLRFKRLVSPREYNAETNKILCEIDKTEFREIVRRTSPDALSAICTANLTSRSGFHSFYNLDWRTWTGIDANQAWMIISAFAGCQPHDDFDADAMESYSCNGKLTSWIEAAIPDVGRFYDEINKTAA